MNTSPASALTLRDPWALVPSLVNLDAYIAATNQIPLLTHEEEVAFATRLRASGDIEAARKLVLSHLRLVVSISRKYLGYGLPHGDLIQEGNIGLMKAVKRFDPKQGVRLVSYAMHWIKAEIHEYLIRNWRIVKVATTKAQRKLFFKLRSMKQNMKAEANADTQRSSLTLTQAGVDALARTLNVRRKEVLEMETRLSASDVSLDPQTDDSEESFAPIAYLGDDSREPSNVLEGRKLAWLAGAGIALALANLDARSQRIVEERWLKVNDDGSGGMTLHELAGQYKVSAERIRQIETAALKKMRKTLTEAA